MSSPTTHLSDAELLFFIDGESSKHEETKAQKHLADCPLCRKRRSEFESVSFEAAHLHPANYDLSMQIRAQERLREKLHTSHTVSLSKWIPQVSLLRCAAVVLVLILATAATTRPWIRKTIILNWASEPKPNRNLTPGATRPVMLAEICEQSDGDDELDPAVPPHTEKTVLQEYGITDVTADSYQIDYLINPQLGGTADISNLWPQPYGKTVWNAHVKDDLERRVNQMVCRNEIDLATAQHEIASDWIRAYKKYFHTSHPL